jgi:2'-5' RNA ligase
VVELKRLFLAVPVPEEIRIMLAQHLRQYELPGRVAAPASWHLTVRFLGGVEEVGQDILTATVDQTDLGPPFDIELGEIGAFPRSAAAGVLWLGVRRGTASLSDLHTRVEEAVTGIGFPAEGRPYAPHLTLSRINPRTDVSALVTGFHPMPFAWKATELALYHSRPGHDYQVLETFPF